MKVNIRMDDITPDMNWHKFNMFKEILDELNIKPLIGVVPNNEDELLHIEDNNREFWKIISELQKNGWIVAMHGVRHQYSTKNGGLFPLNHFSEFAGVPFDKQREEIRFGKEIFAKNGIVTSIFMAPGHTFDKHTVKALLENGFTSITDGFGKKPFYRKGLIYYPIALQRSKVFADSSEGVNTLVYHLNTMTEEQILKEGELLKNNIDRICNFEMQTNVSKQTVFQRIRELLLANFKRIVVLIINR